MQIPFNLGKEISRMSKDKNEDYINNNNQENADYEEIPVVLKLDKNIAEVLRILAICYSNYNTDKNELVNQFLSEEVTKIIHTLAAAPPEPPTFPQSLRDLLRTKVNESTKCYNSSNDDDDNNIIGKYTTTDLTSKEELEKRFGKIPPNEEESNNKEEV